LTLPKTNYASKEEEQVFLHFAVALVQVGFIE